MARASIVPEILAKLEPYLENAKKAWEIQSEPRKATLPLTSDGKVNVRALALSIGLRQNQEQHFYNHADLAVPVNALAALQGVKPIRSRVPAENFDIPEILAKLEAYLEEIDLTWEGQPEPRKPTLPSKDENEVDVRALALAIGLRQSQEQLICNDPALAAPVNVLAQLQGLKAIRSRELVDRADKASRERIAKISAERADLTKLLAEREAMIERQRQEIRSLRSQLELRNETGMTLRTEEIR